MKPNRDPPQARERAGDPVASHLVLVDEVFRCNQWSEDRSLQLGDVDRQGPAVALKKADFIAMGALQRQLGEVGLGGNFIARLGARADRRHEERRRYAEEDTASKETPAPHAEDFSVGRPSSLTS